MTPHRQILSLACATWLWRSARRAARRAGGRRPPKTRTARGRIQICRCSRTPRTASPATTTWSTPSGEDVSIGATWRSTMMANSARDPYWQAGVRRETIDHPKHAPPSRTNAPRATCRWPQRIARAPAARARCSRICRSAGTTAPTRSAWPPTASRARSVTRSRPSTWARAKLQRRLRDQADAARRRARDLRAVPGRRRAARRSCARSPASCRPRRRTSQQSELCASCHTLITQAFGPERRGDRLAARADELPGVAAQRLQPGEASCQSCHMPAAPGRSRIASVLGDAPRRAGAARVRRRQRVHGAAAQPLPRRARRRGVARRARGDGAGDDTSAAAGHGDAVDLRRRSSTGGTLAFDVDVRNLTGHKFPTGYPSRRTWLHVTVRDAQRRARSSNRARSTTSGAIAGQRQRRGSRCASSRTTRRSPAPDQVQIYEPILGDRERRADDGAADGDAVPQGQPPAAARVRQGDGRRRDRRVRRGAAATPNFTGAGDRVRYRDGRPGRRDRTTVEVELRYQSIGYRWAHNLEGYDAPEPKRFVGYYKSMSHESSVVVASARAAVGTSSP